MTKPVVLTTNLFYRMSEINVLCSLHSRIISNNLRDHKLILFDSYLPKFVSVSIVTSCVI